MKEFDIPIYVSSPRPLGDVELSLKLKQMGCTPVITWEDPGLEKLREQIVRGASLFHFFLPFSLFAEVPPFPKITRTRFGTLKTAKFK